LKSFQDCEERNQSIDIGENEIKAQQKTSGVLHLLPSQKNGGGKSSRILEREVRIEPRRRRRIIIQYEKKKKFCRVEKLLRWVAEVRDWC